jgi:hypothetical protein
MNLENRVRRLEKRLGTPPPIETVRQTIRGRAVAEAFSPSELARIEARCHEPGNESLSLREVMESMPDSQDAFLRLGRAMTKMSLRIEGMSESELRSFAETWECAEF